MIRFILGSLALALGCAACSPGEVAAVGDGLQGRITLTGSSTMAPLVSIIGQRFEALHPGVRVDVQTGGSSRGIADVSSGLADIGMSSRALTEEESGDRTEHSFAFDGVGFVVHSANPVTQLSNGQLSSILAGGITNWAEVGGAAGPITVIDRARGRSEVALVTKYLKLAAKDIVPDVVAGENLQVVKQVATDTNSISYLSIGTVETAIAMGSSLRLLPLDGVAATAGNVAKGIYPLARPLLLLTSGTTDENVDAFTEFARSAELHDLIREHAFVPLIR